MCIRDSSGALQNVQTGILLTLGTGIGGGIVINGPVSYTHLDVYKSQDYPDSYPLTILAGPRVLFRMTMPSFGISVGKNSADGSYVLSYDYDNKDFFAGAIDDKCKEYFAFLSKLYSEGLLDPEMADPIDGDKWSQKLATGSSCLLYTSMLMGSSLE